ncbi:MAG: hypothetical protein NC248_03635 [Bacteroides sp.]|nr:hypothetical protein [Bacteroides sp.]MCM1389891.1 hypothetical protein [Bacteroides sp.]
MHKILFGITAAIIFLSSCIEDGFSNSPSDQPLYSTDTLHIGDVFTAQGTPTRNFIVYNRHSKGMIISSIKFRDPATSGYFRVNVDGLPGKEFNNVEIRAKDSIYVLVEATIPENGFDSPRVIDAPLDFTVNGVTSTVVINISGRDVNRITGETLTADTRFTSSRPYLITDSLVVNPGVTLTIDPGASLYFHDKASLKVRGTLIANGTPEAPINFTGDRTGNVVGGIPYELMSGQWDGVRFYETSRENSLSYLSMRNSTSGITIDSIPSDNAELTLVNCRLRNTKSTVISSRHTSIDAFGCEFAEAPAGVIYLHGGNHRFINCTFSNYYLFAAITGPLIHFDGEEITATIDNSILYGLGSMIKPDNIEGMPVTFRNSLLKPAGSDDDNFIDCIWDADPMFYTVREDYIFDYRLRDGSPAIAAANPALIDPAATDFYGIPRGNTPDLGAYVHTPASNQ